MIIILLATNNALDAVSVCVVAEKDTQLETIQAKYIDLLDSHDEDSSKTSIYLGFIDINGDVPLKNTTQFLKAYLLINPTETISWH